MLCCFKFAYPVRRENTYNQITLKLTTEDIGHILYNFNRLDNMAGWHPTGCF